MSEPGATRRTALAVAFDDHRRYLTTVAFRMLGSHADAEDVVQEAWLRLAGSDAVIEDLRAWLTQVVSRLCLDRLRARKRRPEDPLDALPDAERATTPDPQQRAEQADNVGYALLLVLERLTPDERLAYVLHDVFGLPFTEVAQVVERTPQATRKLASRARERVRGGDPVAADARASREQRRTLVDAFLAAASKGDFTALVGVLHPDVEFRIHEGDSGVRIVRGAERVAAQAAEFHRLATSYTFEVVEVGERFALVAAPPDGPASILFFTSTAKLITGLEARRLA